MRPILVVIGVLVFLAGLVFALQGADILMGSVMTGSTTWLAIGIALVVLGLGLVGWGARSGAARQRESKPQPPT